MRAAVIACALALVATSGVRDSRAESLFEKVAFQPARFDPSRGENTEVRVTLRRPATLTVRVYDPDAGLVRTLAKGVRRPVGDTIVLWDGKDEDGVLVPDEAYTVEIGSDDAGEVYDPTDHTGGVVGAVHEPDVDVLEGAIAYRLPSPARVLMRLGIQGGPLLRTLVDWRVRSAGQVSEFWDGLDETGTIGISKEPGLSLLVTYVTLPDASVIAYGNKTRTYAEYKRGAAKARPQRRTRPWRGSHQLPPAKLVPPAWAHAPRVAVEFPDAGAGSIELSAVARVRVDVDAESRSRLVADQFEVMFYVDWEFFTEEERGYLPLNWIWDTERIPPGDHVLTVNVSSLTGQVGTASRRVRILPRLP